MIRADRAIENFIFYGEVNVSIYFYGTIDIHLTKMSLNDIVHVNDSQLINRIYIQEGRFCNNKMI